MTTYLPPLAPLRPVRLDPTALYEKLTLAGQDDPPACEGDDTFIAERADLNPADLKRMRYVCDRCPLRDLCREYATAAKPKAGFWAGAFYGKGTST